MNRVRLSGAAEFAGDHHLAFGDAALNGVGEFGEDLDLVLGVEDQRRFDARFLTDTVADGVVHELSFGLFQFGIYVYMQSLSIVRLLRLVGGYLVYFL